MYKKIFYASFCILTCGTIFTAQKSSSFTAQQFKGIREGLEASEKKVVNSINALQESRKDNEKTKADIEKNRTLRR